MEPLSALSVASAVLQIVDFSSKVLKIAADVRNSALGQAEEAALLWDTTTNFDTLLEGLRDTGALKHRFPSVSKNPESQLVKLAKECHSVAAELHAALTSLKFKEDGSTRSSLEQGLRTVLGQKKIALITNRLDEIRKQVDTALLMSIRYNLQQASKAQLEDVVVSVRRTAEQKKVVALVRDNDWRPDRAQDVEAFSEIFLASVEKDTKRHFIEMILHRLRFDDQADRYEAIAAAHEATFQWLFEENASQSTTQDWDGFPTWLSGKQGKNLYWITGKPGSGKSTMMKFLFNADETPIYLKEWSQDLPLVQAGFFFWNSGTAMQMSREGLLLSMLFSTLKNDEATLLYLFQQRFQQFSAFGGGLHAFSWPELRDAFRTMVDSPLTPRAFFFLIDGLDEFSGDPQELIQLVVELSRHSYVKVCVASRPWLKFADAFENRPSLTLEQLTKQDIHNYVHTHFNNNKHFHKLEKMEPIRAQSLVEQVVDKANGVFLWVNLVVQALMQGLTNADRMSDLQANVDALPPELERLYEKLLKTLDSDYLTHACQLFRLVMYRPNSTVLELWAADNEDEDSAMKTETRLQRDFVDHLELMRRRVVSRGKGLLEVREPHSTTGSQYLVRWIHRSAREYLETDEANQMLLKATDYESFSAPRRWANGYMELLKRLGDDKDLKKDQALMCLEYGLRVEIEKGVCPVRYFEEVHKTALSVSIFYKIQATEFDDPRLEPSARGSFLNLAVRYRLMGYIDAKITDASRVELVNAMRYYDDKSSPLEHGRYKALYTNSLRFTAKDVKRALDTALRLKNEASRAERWRKTKEKLKWSR